MKYFLKLLFVLLLSPLSGQDYFQQKVDYKIQAQLDTLTQKLIVNCTLNYTNNADDDLNYLLMHIWWNAFSDKRSAYADQSLMMQDRRFFFAQDEDLGGYNQIQFSDDSGELIHSPYNDGSKDYNDIVRLHLTKPIKSGEQKEINVRYELDIHKVFSRSGYEDKLYRFTQWYPKPAVFDKKGWHPMPYLSYGEYYSEFGDYEVSLTIPISHSIAHTGTKQSDLTKLNLEDRTRTEIITAENVHDFAWFSSEYFIPYTGGITINDNPVNLHVFVKEDYEDWEKILNYAKEAVLFFSNEVAPYPYEQLTVVQAPDIDESGMEYPMVTILSFLKNEQNLDHLITHEIGHNWFYGILASNERRHPWMDEGMTSFYDHKYDHKHYKSANYNNLLPLAVTDEHELSLLQTLLMSLQKTGRAQSMNLSSENFDPLSYAAVNYEKAAWAFKYLESYLGEEMFKNCITDYYNKWKFKHPYPEDLKQSFSDTSGKDLSWFFNGIVEKGDTYDLVLKKIKTVGNKKEVTIFNKGPLSLPFHISQFDSTGNLVGNEWFESIPVEESRTFMVENIENSKTSINGAFPFVDIKRRNNHSSRDFKFSFLGNTDDSRKNQINYFPSLLYNKYDGFMFGFNLYNNVLPLSDMRWFVNANFGFKSKSLAGILGIEKDFLIPRKNFRKLTFGFHARRFHQEINEGLNYDLSYHKYMPFFRAHFTNEKFRNSSLSYKTHIIDQQIPIFTDQMFDDTEIDRSVIHQLNYKQDWNKGLSQNNFLVQLEYETYDKPSEEGANYLKLSTEFEKTIFYNPKNTFQFRLFGGYFLMNSERESSSFYNVFSRGSFALSSQGFTDHTFENYFIGRTGDSSQQDAQIVISEGGFKNAFGSAFSTGMSNDYMLAGNFKVNLPMVIMERITISPFLDAAYVSTKSSNADPLEAKFFYSGGIAIDFKEVLGFYIPVFYSDEFKSNYSGQGFFARMTYRMDWDRLNLWKLADNPTRLIGQ